MPNDEGHAGAVSLAVAGLQSLILINGGGAVALLAFYGEALSEGRTGGIDLRWFEGSLLLFALGVAAAAFATILAYISQLFWTQTRGAPGKRDTAVRVAAILGAFLSAALFVVGIVFAALAI
ncbi:MAG: hypothetical protein GC189_11595 [Alphaproteobacteria bacterium]|nr:hypothetical protein [Alphaproteobacteria bacterium]